MWVSKRFDLTWADLAFALGRCIRPGAAASASTVERLASPAGQALACLSVRSGFDLFLEAAGFPEGSEVVFSAMTVADMPRIADAHGLVPVGCDLAPGAAAPGVAELERACTPKTRAVVLAHLFGSRMDVGPLVELCRRRGIVVVEDCAQAYSGRGYHGHPGSDLVLFSFGPIKHATALGGGVAFVRDGPVCDRMRALHDVWPRQPRGEYLRRVLKYSVLHALSLRPTYTLAAGAARVTGVDVDGVTNRLTRGFAGPDFFRRIRRRPSVPLLEMLGRRLRQDTVRLGKQEARVRSLLEVAGLAARCPGADTTPHTFWLVPILCADPGALIETLRHHGFDATRGRSFAVVPPRQGVNAEAERVHAHAVYVPVYPAMPDAEVRRLAAVLGAAFA